MKANERHAGRYSSKRQAEEWRDHYIKDGNEARIEPCPCWDVIVTTREKKP